MRISEIIQADLAFAKQCDLQSCTELQYLLDGTRNADPESAVLFLKDRYKQAEDIVEASQRELVRSICNIYLHMLGRPEKVQK